LWPIRIVATNQAAPHVLLAAGFVAACTLYNTSSSGGRTIITFAITTAGNYTLTVLGPSGLVSFN
jgi:hypothetical protein